MKILRRLISSINISSIQSSTPDISAPLQLAELTIKKLLEMRNERDKYDQMLKTLKKLSIRSYWSRQTQFTSCVPNEFNRINEIGS